MVGNENERLDTRRLCAALLEYGAAAQRYFDHNEDSLCRSGLNAYSPEAFLGDHLKTATGESGDLCQKIAVYGEMARQRFS